MIANRILLALICTSTYAVLSATVASVLIAARCTSLLYKVFRRSTTQVSICRLILLWYINMRKVFRVYVNDSYVFEATSINVYVRLTAQRGCC